MGGFGFPTAGVEGVYDPPPPAVGGGKGKVVDGGCGVKGGYMQNGGVFCGSGIGGRES